MKKKTFIEKRQGDWVRDQLRLSLQHKLKIRYITFFPILLSLKK